MVGTHHGWYSLQWKLRLDSSSCQSDAVCLSENKLVFRGDSLSSSHIFTHSLRQSGFIKFIQTFNLVPSHTISYNLILSHTNQIPSHATLYHIIPSHTIPYHPLQFYTISYKPIPYHIIAYHLVPCHTISYHLIPSHPILQPSCAISYYPIPFQNI